MADANIQCEDNGSLARQQQHHASGQIADNAMRFLPDLALFNIQRWIGFSSNPPISENSDAKPKRMNAQVDWEVEEFERDLALRFATRDLSLQLARADAIVEAADDPHSNNATPTPTSRHGISSVKPSLRRRWLRSQDSNATIQALSAPCRASSLLPAESDSEYEGSIEELDFNFSDTRPSTPSTTTPPPYPLAHYSSRAGEEDYVVEELHTPEGDMHTDEDMEVMPTLTSSPLSSPSPTTAPVTPVSSASDKGRHRNSIRGLFRTSLNSSNTVYTDIASTKVTTTTTTSQSVLSLVSHFSSCTSACGDSDPSLLNDEEGGRDPAQMSSLLHKVRRLTLSHRQLPLSSTVRERKRDSRAETASFTRRSERRSSLPAGTSNPMRTQEPVPPLPCTSPIVLKDTPNKRRSVINETASKMKRKKKRLIIRGIGQDDWEAVEGLGKWASGLGEVRKMTRARDGTMWIEFRDRKVADNVCCLQARVEISGVGYVVIDWMESRQAG